MSPLRDRADPSSPALATTSSTRRQPSTPDALSARSRTPRACASCSRQKLRCDGMTPCNRCVTTGHPSACRYLPSMRGKTRKRKADQSNTREKGLPRISAPESSASSLAADGPDEGSISQAPDAEYLAWQEDNRPTRRQSTNTALWGEKVYATGRRPSSPLRPDGPSLRKSREPVDRLTTLPLPGDAHNPLAVLAEASAAAHSPRSPEQSTIGATRSRAGDGDIAAESHRLTRQDEGEGEYYAPLEAVLKDEAPHIMRYLNVHEAEQLFEMYFKHLHPHLPVLDREHSSPAAVARRNNFLFNAICCVAARAFNVVLWERLKMFARFEMERLPKEKNIEVVQGHLIYASWNLNRPKHFESDLTWLRVGLAVRTALDINLHRVALVGPARAGLPPWLLRSIIRTWLLACITDRTLSAQLGKPASMQGEGSVDMYVKLLVEMEGEGREKGEDLWIGAQAEWTQILSRAMDIFRSDTYLSHPTSPSHFTASAPAFPDLVHVFSKQFAEWQRRARASIRECHMDEADDLFFASSLQVLEGYARLVIHSFGLDRALRDDKDGRDISLPASLAEYTTSAVCLTQRLLPASMERALPPGLPDFTFTIFTYAIVSLLRTLQPHLAARHLTHGDNEPSRQAILHMTRSSADLLARSAVTRDHPPASQSVFLSRLIDVRERETSTGFDAGDRQHHAASPQLDAGNKGTWTPSLLDFEAFAQRLEQDDRRALWPPQPSPHGPAVHTNVLDGVLGKDGPTVQSGETLQPLAGSEGWHHHMHTASSTPRPTEYPPLANLWPSASPMARSGANPATEPPIDLQSWIAQNGFAVPDSALGLGGTSNLYGEDQMMWDQDGFWKSLMELSKGAESA